MVNTMVKTFWLASLSDGTTVIENNPPFEPDAAGSSWLKLQRHIIHNKLEITGLRIQVEVDDLPTRTYTLPSRSPKQKWAHLKPLLPVRFDYYRRNAGTSEASKDELGRITMDQAIKWGVEKYIEIHAIYEHFTLIMIVDELAGNDTWSVIVTR